MRGKKIRLVPWVNASGCGYDSAGAVGASFDVKDSAAGCGKKIALVPCGCLLQMWKEDSAVAVWVRCLRCGKKIALVPSGCLLQMWKEDSAGAVWVPASDVERR
ncbi:hypothetical protein RRG08_060704 [Elysia crispata]|uniref:Uncharacterized protein n=1 Tax=Elysia crispata TaxID=231223 RepID=A0AAE0ZLX1_9GAST|nr:hypothetical protein RRG08_060704 [Elysia crispata]